MSETAAPCTPAEALQRLKAGNARFVRGEAKFPTVQASVLASLKNIFSDVPDTLAEDIDAFIAELARHGFVGYAVEHGINV